ncbi:Uncharacterised protein [Catenibacterium mitsuokai]|nr:Uncharacterised protein [Catenibacterium mitsuokai]
MTTKTKKRICTIHSYPIIDNRHTACTTLFNKNRDTFCLGIDTIFCKFFNNTSRTFNNFSCRNLIG